GVIAAAAQEPGVLTPQGAVGQALERVEVERGEVAGEVVEAPADRDGGADAEELGLEERDVRRRPVRADRAEQSAGVLEPGHEGLPWGRSEGAHQPTISRLVLEDANRPAVGQGVAEGISAGAASLSAFV